MEKAGPSLEGEEVGDEKINDFRAGPGLEKAGPGLENGKEDTKMLLTSIQFPNLNITLNNLPKSVNLFGLDIAFYGMIIAFGMIMGIMIACHEAKITGQDPNDYLDFAIYAIILSVIGARIYYVIFSWDEYKGNLLSIINIRNGGLAIYGGVITAILTCFVYSKIKKMSFPKMCDTGILGLLLGQIIGRWGNFFNREAFGQVVSDSHRFAMRIFFDQNYERYQVPDSVAQGMEKMTGKTLEQLDYIQVQPTFLYESVWNLGLLCFLLVMKKRKKFDGEVILWYLMGYGLGRFIIEGYRSDQLIMPITGWPVSQALSAAVFVGATIIWLVIRLKCRKSENDKVVAES